MRYRYIIATMILAATALQTVAQALTERYNKRHPLRVVISRTDLPYEFKDSHGEASGSNVDIIKALAEELDLPVAFLIKEEGITRTVFEQGDADLIVDDNHGYANTDYIFSENIVNYKRIRRDSIAELFMISKDRYLIEQLDDQYTRLKLRGDIAAINTIWLHPEHREPEPSQAPFYIGIIGIIALVVLATACVVLKTRNTIVARNSEKITGITSMAQEMGEYYVINDTEAQHKLQIDYETLFSNPYVAISFFDKNGLLIEQNDAMNKLQKITPKNQIKPLYNADGQIVNYFVTVGKKDWD